MFKKALLVGLLLVATQALADWERGVAALRAGEYATAAAEFRQVTQQSPDFAGGYAMLGQSLSRLGDSSGALVAFRAAYELEPSNIQNQVSLARGYASAGRSVEACTLIGKINPGDLPEHERAAFQQLIEATQAATGTVCSIWP
jgi:Flp pilus assembly protein TadD